MCRLWASWTVDHVSSVGDEEVGDGWPVPLLFAWLLRTDVVVASS